MKNLTYGFVMLLLSLFAIEACTKTNGLSTVQLVASKASVHVNERDSLAVIGAAPSDSVIWSVSPAGFDTLIVHGKAAIIKFTKTGTYTVTATVNGVPVTTSITVTDIPVGTEPVQLSLAYDQITLTPALYKSSGGDTTYIYFTATTTNHYLCTNSKINAYGTCDSANNLGILFYDVTQPGSATCQSGSGTISTVIPIRQYAPNPYMVNGTYQFKVIFNGTNYNGSITITATNITFNWTYTSGVMITPTTISR